MRLSLMALMAHLCWRLHTGKRLCSEEQLQAELNLSGRCGGCSDEACRGVDCASGKYNRIGNTEVCMVESVEEFRPELYVRFFRHDDIFKQRQVHLGQAGPAKSSPSQIPPCTDLGQDKRVWIEPLGLLSQQHRPRKRWLQRRPVRISRIPIP